MAKKFVTYSGKMITQSGKLWTEDTGACDGNPSMDITITSSLTQIVQWLGHTWNLPADSGVTKTICPTSYDLGALNHTWGAETAIDKFTLKRSLTAESSFATNRISATFHYSDSYGDPAYTYNRPSYDYWVSPAPANYYTHSHQLDSLIAGISRPTPNDYQLTNAFFGSYTQLGITRTWQKGADWPA